MNHWLSMSGSLRCGSSLKLKVDLMKVQIPPPRWSFGRSRRQVAYPRIEMSWSVTFEDNQDSVITTIRSRSGNRSRSGTLDLKFTRRPLFLLFKQDREI